MKKENPDRKVGIITFSEGVEIIGDGMKDCICIGSTEMENYDYLLKNACAISRD
jgi:hypothetical protein